MQGKIRLVLSPYIVQAQSLKPANRTSTAWLEAASRLSTKRASQRWRHTAVLAKPALSTAAWLAVLIRASKKLNVLCAINIYRKVKQRTISQFANQCKRLRASKGQEFRNQTVLRTLNQKGRNQFRPSHTLRIFSSNCCLLRTQRTLNRAVKVLKRALKTSLSSLRTKAKLANQGSALTAAAASGRLAPNQEKVEKVQLLRLFNSTQMSIRQNLWMFLHHPTLASRGVKNKKRHISLTK